MSIDIDYRHFNEASWLEFDYDEIEERIYQEFNKLDKYGALLNSLHKIYMIQIVLKEHKLIYNSIPECSILKDFDFNDPSLDLYNHPDHIHTIILNKFNSRDDGKDYWVSNPDKLAHYFDFEYDKQPKTFIILEFNKEIELINNNYFLHNFRDFWKNDWNHPTYDEAGRKSASDLLFVLLKNKHIVNELHIISSTLYEGAECKGCMLFSDVEIDIELEEHVHISEHKRIRKLLETTGEREGEIILLVHPKEHFAYGFKINTSDFVLPDNDGVYIKFNGRLNWSCTIDKSTSPTFYFENMQAKLYIEDVENDISFEEYQSVFPNIELKIESLNSLVNEAKKQNHGTMLVILDKERASKEANRLRQSSTLITPKVIPHSAFFRLTNIDGAIIVDTEGKCYAFGAILDGESVDAGNPGRGARYNSALRYLNSMVKNNINCLIVIVSEDGYIDIISTEDFKEAEDSI